MEELGALLQQRRIEKGLSLSNVESALKIRRAYLEAIEHGLRNRLPAEVYTRGFIKIYADYLGLDSDEMLRLYDAQSRVRSAAASPPSSDSSGSLPRARRTQQRRRTERKVRRKTPTRPRSARTETASMSSSSGHGSSEPLYGPPMPLQRRGMERWGRWVTLLFLGALVVIVLFIWPGGEQSPGQVMPPANDENTPIAQEPKPSEEPDESLPQTPPEPEEVEPEVEQPDDLMASRLQYRLAQADEIELRIEAHQNHDAWVGEIVADGSAVAQRTLRPGESLTLTAERELALRVGYPLGVRLELNGIDLGALASPNPQDLTFLRE